MVTLSEVKPCYVCNSGVESISTGIDLTYVNG